VTLPYDLAFTVITKAGRVVKARPVGKCNPLFVFEGFRPFAPSSFRTQAGYRQPVTALKPHGKTNNGTKCVRISPETLGSCGLRLVA
jgi:hypothetical protein